MTLTPEQKKAVTDWVTAGASLSDVQKKLSEQFKLSMTYRDVRFLIDDLNLELKDAAPKVDTSDVTKAAAPRGTPAAGEKKGFLDKAKEKLGLGKGDETPSSPDEDVETEEDYEDMPAGGPSSVSVSVDKVTLNPSAIASGSVTFSDGVTAKWMVDQYGRPGLMEVSKPGYRPSATDAQAFMQELSVALQKRGF